MNKPKLEKSRAALLMSAGFLATAFAAPSPTWAQEAETAMESDAIVVQGIRRGLANAIELKRDADTNVDAISAGDLGRFPDENVAESLQRITGVQINRVRGEGSTVSIRGLPQDFTQVLYNGRILTSATDAGQSVLSGNGASNRLFDFTILPSEFLSTLQVYKGAVAELDEGGLAGTVVVRTPRPLEIGRRQAAATFQEAWESNSGEYTPRVSGIYSDVFANRTLGVTLGASYTERRPETHIMQTSGFAQTFTESGIPGTRNRPIDLNGNGVLEPGLGVDFFVRNAPVLTREERERLSLAGLVQVRPTDNVEIRFDVLYSQLDVKSERFEYLPQNVTALGPTIPSEITVEDVNGRQRAVRFGIQNNDLRGGSRFEDRYGDVLSIALGGDLTLGRWTLSSELAISESQQKLDNLNLTATVFVPSVYDATVDADVASLIFPGTGETLRFDPNAHVATGLNGPFGRRFSDDLSEIRFDARRDLDFWGSASLQFGLKYGQRQEQGSNEQLTLTEAQLRTLAGLPNSTFPGIVGRPSAASLLQLISAGNGTFLDSYDGPAEFPTSWLATDTRGFLEGFTREQLAAAGSITNLETGIIDVEERVSAAYLRFNIESPSGDLSGNFGVRAVKTEQVSAGASPDLTQIRVLVSAGGVTQVPPSAPITVTRDYTEILPTLNLRWEITNDLLARFGVSRTMSRPSLDQLSPTTVANGTARTLTQQNPNLDPFLSNNIDASVEWYFAPEGALTFQVFQKEIESLVRSELTTQVLPLTQVFADGSTSVTNETFTVNRLTNGEGVTVRGFEIGYQQPFSFLPSPFDGLGVLMNYTYIDNSDPLSLTGASENNYNVSTYYEKGPLGLRLSYTWRDEFLAQAAGPTDDGLVAQSYGVLDGNITVDLGNHFSIVLEGINLLDEANVIHDGDGFANQYIDPGRRILLGLRARL